MLLYLYHLELLVEVCSPFLKHLKYRRRLLDQIEICDQSYDIKQD